MDRVVAWLNGQTVRDELRLEGRVGWSGALRVRLGIEPLFRRGARIRQRHRAIACANDKDSAGPAVARCDNPLPSWHHDQILGPILSADELHITGRCAPRWRLLLLGRERE